MKMTKRILSMLLAVVMVFSLGALNYASAEEDVEYCVRVDCDGVCEWRDESTDGCAVTRGLYCSVCNTRKIGETVYNHNYQEYAKIEATCVAAGTAYFACANYGCYSTTTEVLPIVPDAHTYSDWTVTKEPTCNEKGSRYATCLNTYTDANGETATCPHVLTEEITVDNNAHVFDGEWIRRAEPTCEADGEEYTICTVCNIAESTRVVPAHSNTWHEYDRVESDCEREGKSYVVCTECNTNGVVTIPINEEAHIWLWTTQQVATCTQQGINKAVCRWHADATKTEYVDMADHISSEVWTTIKEATCSDKGREVILCKNCAYEFESRAVAEKAHTASKWIITSGNCATGGTAKKVCVYPHYDKDGQLTEHLMETTTFTAGTHINRQAMTVNATCINDGYTVDWCPDCQEEFSERVIIKASHTLPESWTVVKAATCEETGLEIKQCEKCDYYQQQEIAKKDHLYMITVDPLPAGCFEDGHTGTRLCLNCRYVLEPEVLEATGHIDADNNGCCDKCFVYFVDTDDGVVECDCFCHNSDGLAQFIFKLLNFFYKLFNINQTCECGKLHYEKSSGGIFGGLFG